jgi:ribose 1,5-bisphosphokinase
MSAAIGLGRLVLVVGPSGVGKDTLIGRAHAVLRDNHSIVFPRRTVTRPANDAENHDCMTEHEFERALGNGMFALAWNAYGLNYGIPASIDADVRSGRTVVSNVSRGVVEQARGRYQRVAVVLLTASAEVLAQRLSARERDSDGPIAERLTRNQGLNKTLRPDFTIENSSLLDQAARKLIAIIRHGRTDRDFPAELLF